MLFFTLPRAHVGLDYMLFIGLKRVAYVGLDYIAIYRTQACNSHFYINTHFLRYTPMFFANVMNR